MLQDAIFASDAWLKQSGNEDIAVKFLRASYKGWISAATTRRSASTSCSSTTPSSPRATRRGMLNEVNGLIWPSPNGIGMIDKAAFDRTVQVALDGKILTKPVEGTPWRNDLAQKALDSMTGVDTKGTSWQKSVVTLTEGGK